jgi:hypothetical protein
VTQPLDNLSIKLKNPVLFITENVLEDDPLRKKSSETPFLQDNEEGNSNISLLLSFYQQVCSF